MTAPFTLAAGDAAEFAGTPAWRPPPDAVLATASFGMAAIPHLAALLGVKKVVRASLLNRSPDGYVGWGVRFAARRSRWHARLRAKPFWTVEDGFIRSVGLGKDGAPALSAVIDDIGIYYDAARPSRLEKLIGDSILSPVQIARAERLTELIVSRRLTKYNSEPDRRLDLPMRRGACIVLVDQVARDASIAGALADDRRFFAMAAAARDERPDAFLCLRVHPDVAAGRAKGVLAERARELGLHVLADQVNSHAVLDAADEIWTVSSQLGFEALLRGKKTVCFGVPFYAGFGLTDDRPEGEAMRQALARRRPARLADLIYAVFVDYAAYADPVHRCRLTPEAAMERLFTRRQAFERRSGNYLCAGFSAWKQPMVKAFLEGPFSRVRFAADTGGRMADEKLCLWGARDDRDADHPPITIEDGFIRSVGLGSDFLPPISLCIDDTGIYYDSRHPSRLEELLQSHAFDPQLVARAKTVRQRIVAAAITKYNLGSRVPDDLRARAAGRRIILVPGQVETDASIRYGAPLFTRNIDLLKAVRRAEPAAFIIYKEHPDVIAGNRPGRVDRQEAGLLCDLFLEEGDLMGWLDAVDALHVNTSLAGFEALLRGKDVTCWGQPFFAGWGLTTDKAPVARRTRRLALDELVAATLILYPCYVDPITRQPIEIEDALHLIETWRRDGPPDPHHIQPRGRVERAWRYVRAGLIARWQRARGT